jgi:hypothetical protein
VPQCSSQVFSSCYGHGFPFQSINDIQPVIYNIMVQARVALIVDPNQNRDFGFVQESVFMICLANVLVSQ